MSSKPTRRRKPSGPRRNRAGVNHAAIEAETRRTLALLERGEASLAQAVDLTGAEIARITHRAHGLRRAGRLDEAMALFGLLLTFDPFDAERWVVMGGLKQRTGEPLVALSCYRVASTLGAASAELESRQAAIQSAVEHQLARAGINLAHQEQPR